MQIGIMLKEAREEKGLSLDDIQDMTKIQKRYLAAIEQEDYHALPGRFYARAFIREYAQAVELNPDVLLEEFDEDSIESQEEENAPYTRFERSKRSDEKGSSVFAFLPTVIVVVLIIGIIFVAYFLLQKSSSNSSDDSEIPQENDEIVRKKDGETGGSKEKENKEDEDEEQKESDEEAEEDEIKFEVVEVGEGNSPLSTLDFQYSSDEVILSLKSSGETYLQILNSEESVLFEGSLTEDTDVDDLDLSDEERVYLNIGNVPSLTVTINGEELEYPVDKNERVHQKLWINLKKEE